MLMQQSMKFGMFYTTNEVPNPVVKNSGLKKRVLAEDEKNPKKGWTEEK